MEVSRMRYFRASQAYTLAVGEGKVAAKAAFNAVARWHKSVKAYHSALMLFQSEAQERYLWESSEQGREEYRRNYGAGSDTVNTRMEQ